MEVRELWFFSRQGHETSLFTKTSGPIMDTIKLPIERSNEESYAGIKRPGQENG